jgi:hypothetical protein
MAERIPQSVSYLVVFRAYLASDGKTPATGKTIAITISKNGGAFGNPNAGATNATEISSGFYKFTLDTTDTGTLGQLAWRGAQADINDAGDVLTVAKATNGGFSALPDAAAEAAGGIYTRGTGAGQISQTNNGRVDSDVQSIANNAITAAAIATGAIDADAIADNAIDAGAIASDAIAAAKIAAGAITSAKFAAGAIDAAAIATGAIDADALAADAGTEIGTAVWATAARTLTAGTNIQLPSNGLANITAWTVDITGNMSGSVGSVTGNVGGNVIGNVSGNVTGTIGGLTAAALKDFFDTDSTTTYASAVAGSVVKEIADNAGGSSLTEAGIAAEVWLTATRTLTAIDEDSTTLDLDATIRSAVGLAAANLDTQIGDLPTNAELATALGTADDAILAQVALVKAKTDSLTFTVANVLDANIQYVNDVLVQGTGAVGDEWGP